MQESEMIAHNFLNLPEELSGWDNSRFVIIPAPYDATASLRPGARFGPQSIISISPHLEIYDEEMRSGPWRTPIHTLKVPDPPLGAPERYLEQLESQVRNVIAADKFPLVLGGEHTVSLAAVRALRKLHGQQDFTYVQLDAHCDLRDSYRGTPYSHACVARRIAEQGVPIVQIGVRTWSWEEEQFLRQATHVRMIQTRELRERGFSTLYEQLQLSTPLYLSIDLDVLDPAVMPAVGVPEPGGLSWDELLEVLRLLITKHSVLGADVCEFSPLPGLVYPELTAARLILKLISYLDSISEMYATGGKNEKT